jgi:DNA-binding SARP family transcriptional activator
VVGMLWPESDESTARHRLSVALHVLRQRLGEESILRHGDALALPGERWQVDALRFEDAFASGDFVAARSVYGGQLMDGIFLRRAPAFEHWLEQWRARLVRRHTAVLESLAAEADRRGDAAAAIELHHELITEEPWSAARTLALMHALAAQGREEGAIRCSQAYALAVREELGMVPDPAVLACAESIVQGRAQAHSAMMTAREVARLI